MHARPLFRSLGVAICGFLAANAPLEAGQKLSAVKIGSRIDVSIGGGFFTSYRFSDEEKYPFFFPVNGPSGSSVTSMRNGEYPHHSSLFFGCDMVNGGNYWQDGLERGQIVSTGATLEVAAGERVVINDQCSWRRPGGQPIRDTRRIVISCPSPSLRQIDFEITLEALEEVTISKTNHSLFSARMDPDLTPVNGGAMINAEGLSGEKGTFGKESPWLACFGARGKVVEGLAILQHPGNAGYPSKWFTRDYGFLSPTPMFWPENGKTTVLTKGAKLPLRYRVLVFSGTAEKAGVADHFKAYSSVK